MKTTNIFLKISNLLLLMVVVQFMLGCKASNTTKGVAIGAGS